MSEKIIFSAENVNGKTGKFFDKFSLSEINFSLPEGYIMGIAGKNGAGKTTFFRYIMSRKKLYSGSFFLNGREIHDDIRSTLDSVAFISEDVKFLNNASAAENADIIGRFYSRYEKNLFEEMMKKMDLSSGMKADEMSKGQNMRFQLALSAFLSLSFSAQ